MIYIIKKILLTILLLSTLIVACTGEYQEETQPFVPALEVNQEVEEDAVVMPVEEQVSTQTSLEEEFSRLINLTSSYTVNYRLSTTYDNNQRDEFMTWYVQGRDQTRMDTRSQTPQGVQRTQTFITQEEVISCIEEQNSWTCFSLDTDNGAIDTGEGVGVTDVFEEWEANTQELEFLDTSSKTILGEETTCFTFRENNIRQELCLTQNGVLLYMKSEFPGGSQVMQATSYSNSVLASDFEPPAEPQDLADMFAYLENIDW